MLTHFVRDRTRGEKMPIEFAVRRQTKDTARLFGLNDRGTLETGMRADLNVIDMEKLRIFKSEINGWFVAINGWPNFHRKNRPCINIKGKSRRF